MLQRLNFYTNYYPIFDESFREIFPIENYMYPLTYHSIYFRSLFENNIIAKQESLNSLKHIICVITYIK